MAAAKKSTKKRSSATATKIEKEARNAAATAYKRQIGSVVLFALAVLLMCLVCIKNEGAWLWYNIHNFILGVFGVCSFIWPVLLGIVAVLYAMNKLYGSLGGKIILSSVIIVLIGAVIDVFSAHERVSSFVEYVSLSYSNGSALKGGGVLGGVLGYALNSSCGKSGAAIILFILIFVLIMLVTGTTLIAFFKAIYLTVKKPMDKIGESVEDAFVERQENNPEEKKSRVFAKHSDIDISVDDIPEKRERSGLDLSAKQRKVIEAYRDEEMSDEELGELKSIELDEAVSAAKNESAKKTVRKRNTAETKPVNSSGIVIKNEGYTVPSIDLLQPPSFEDSRNAGSDLESTAEHLVETLRSFGVETRIVDISRGPSVTRYELQPCAGVRISKITNLADDIALSLAASGVRIEAPIPNKSAVGIEVPNKNTRVVRVREIIDSAQFRNSKSKLTITLGKDIGGNVIVTDIAKMPHCLIAGTTGSGKSVCINSIIMSILYKASPDEVKFLMIDPKVVELGVYNGIPHLLVPVVTEPRKAAGALGWAVSEMDKRYKLFAENAVRDIEGYNKIAEENPSMKKLEQVVIIIDELADLMMTAPKEVEDAIVRIAQKARAAGMHLIVATQRPSADIVTGLIKANIPSRIAFAVSSQIDSRVILDANGAEKLMGRGDMLFSPVGATKPNRIQGCFVTEEEVEKVVEFVKASAAEENEYDTDVIAEIERQAEIAKNGGKSAPEPEGDDDTDAMFDAAVEVILDAGQASTSLLQRRLKLGYARAARIVDQMEMKGIIGAYEGSKPRQILITKAQWLERNAMGGSVNESEDADF